MRIDIAFQLPIHQDLNDLDRTWLHSRTPSMRTAKALRASDFNHIDLWEQEFRDACPAKCQNLPCINQKPPVYEESRKIWTSIHRRRTGHGKCTDLFYKWNRTLYARCDGGAARWTIQHRTKLIFISAKSKLLLVMSKNLQHVS